MSKDLYKEGHDFALFQAIRILERIGGGPRLGREGPAAAETIRLRPDTSLGFAPSDVTAIDRTPPSPAARDQPQRLRVTTGFGGLYGVTSPLPSYYGEALVRPDSDTNRVRDFLDLFHHRLLSLLYRTFTRHHYHAEFAADGSDDLSRRLLCWLGIDARAAMALGVPAVRLLRHAGLLIGRNRPPRALEILWSELCEVPIRVSGNQGRWVTVPVDQQARLGTQSSRLGQDLVIGRRIHDVSGKFRITVGPVEYETFESFLPGGPALERLGQAIHLALPSAFDYEVELLLRADSRRPFQLGGTRQSRLGWTTWAGVETATRAADATVVFQATSAS